jgi:hypothetical protein
MKSVKTALRFTVTGVVLGLLIGWLLSLVSGNVFVVAIMGALGLTRLPAKSATIRIPRFTIREGRTHGCSEAI